MIKVTITKDKKEKYVAYEAVGHANDSVCVSISSVSQCIINSIFENTQSAPLLSENPGMTKMRLVKMDSEKESVQLLMKTLVDFTYDLTERYPKHLTIITRLEGE